MFIHTYLRNKDLSPFSDKHITAMTTRLKQKSSRHNIIPRPDCFKLQDLYVIEGHSFDHIQLLHPEYDIQEICITAVCHKWHQRRKRRLVLEKEIAKNRVMKTSMEQIGFLTCLLDIANKENMDKARAYLEDPLNTPKPDFKIETLQQYERTLDMLQQLIKTAMIFNNDYENKKSSQEVLDAQVKAKQYFKKKQVRYLEYKQKRRGMNPKKLTILDVVNGNKYNADPTAEQTNSEPSTAEPTAQS